MNPCCVEDADLVFGAVKVVVFPGFELLSRDEKAKLLEFFKDAPFKREVHALKDVSKDWCERLPIVKENEDSQNGIQATNVFKE